MAPTGTDRTAVLTLPSETRIQITREFDAPQHLVYRAYTEPELIKRWWAGNRGEVTSVAVDLRVGGDWRYVMTTNSGHEVAFHGEYREIVPNERIVSTDVFEGAPDAATVTTMTLAEHEGRTLLTLVTDTGSPEIRDAIVNSGMESGMQESYAALEQVARSIADA